MAIREYLLETCLANFYRQHKKFMSRVCITDQAETCMANVYSRCSYLTSAVIFSGRYTKFYYGRNCSCWENVKNTGNVFFESYIPGSKEIRKKKYSFSLIRGMSNLPENLVYGGPKSQSPWKRITLNHLAAKYKAQEPITMVTAYDYPSAVHVDNAGIDICLVGDSVGMVVHGHDTTLPVTMEDMLLHCRAVARGASRPLLVGDLPFGSYEESKEQAVASAVRLLKEGGMDAIKLEGGTPSRVLAAKAIVEAGIAVIGHVGLTPQAISVLGGFRPQGRNVSSATKVLESALALQDAGCFAIVLECIPSPVAAAITSVLHIPTIGIGAGPNCSGQVLVYHDLLLMTQHPHHAQVTPKFCKSYGNIGIAINEALSKYREEVVSKKFPSTEYSPYQINESSIESFISELEKRGLNGAAKKAAEVAEVDFKSREPCTGS